MIYKNQPASAIRDLEKRMIVTNTSIPWSPDGYKYRSVLQIFNISFLDTGYYACHYKKEAKDMEDERIAIRTYIYVEGIVRIHLVYVYYVQKDRGIY